MTIEIYPEDVRPPAGATEEEVEQAIEMGLAFARVVAPCIDKLTGNKEIVARGLIIQAINYRFNEPTVGPSNVSIGPFRSSQEADTSYFPEYFTKQLRSLCGKKSSFGVLTLEQKLGCHNHHIDFVKNDTWDSWNGDDN